MLIILRNTTREGGSMTKIKIVFKDKSKITYTINKAWVDWKKYWDRHKNQKNLIESAILQQYPKKDFEPVDLLKDY